MKPFLWADVWIYDIGNDLMEYIVDLPASLTPNRIKYDGSYYKILKIDDIYKLKRYSIITDKNNRLQKVYLWNGLHPNAGNRTSDGDIIKILGLKRFEKLELCIDSKLLNQDILADYIGQQLEAAIEVWGLDDPWVKPKISSFDAGDKFLKYYKWREAQK